jgi:hypothetical protein
MQSNTPQPSRLAATDWNLVPSVSWRIDYLVTWVALNAYRAYDRTYRHFRSGYRFDARSAQELAQIAAAMSALALSKVTQDKAGLLLLRLADRHEKRYRDRYGVELSLRSLSQPHYFVRQADALGNINASSTVLHAQDATFRLLWGLADANNGVSLESVRYPDHYLRHHSGRIKADADDGSESFKTNATFRIEPGLANPVWSSFKSIDRTGSYICQREGRLYLDSMVGKTGASLVQFLRDATFLLRQPWQPMTQQGGSGRPDPDEIIEREHREVTRPPRHPQ